MATEQKEQRPGPDAPATPPATAGATPWPVVLLITFLLGSMAGGVAVYALGWAVPRTPPASPVAAAAPIRAPEPAPAELPLQPAVEPQRIDLEGPPGGVEGTATAEPEAAEPLPIDPSPAGVRAACGAAVLSLTAYDVDGDPRPTVPAARVGPSRVLAPYSAVEGAERAFVRGADRVPIEVTGVFGHAPQYDIVLLEVGRDLPEPYLLPREQPLEAPCEAVLLGAADDAAAWREVAVTVAPGALDRLTGGPRLALEHATGFPGVLVDAEGNVVALAPEGNTVALAVHAASAWNFTAAAVPLDAFSRTTGPGSPVTRMKRARKFLSQRRYEEAARLFLMITAEEPRLIPEVEADLRLAAEEAARSSITAGNGGAAVILLTEALARLPADAALWALRGRGLAVAGNVRQAIDSFLRAMELDPTRQPAWSSEAVGLLMDEVNRLHSAGLTRDALLLLLDERSAFPGDGRIRMTAGGLLLHSRRFAEAATLYSEAAVLDAAVAGEARREAGRARDLAGGPGAVVVDFPPGADRIVVAARINGAVAARLLIDPAEEYSVIPAGIAAQAGYSLAAARRIRFFSDPGADETPTLELRTVTVAGVTSDRIQAVVVDGYAAPVADGVLGATYLSRFRTVEDRSLGRLVLYPR